MYWDANNLYGWAMSQSLPYEDLKFDNEKTLKEILETPDNNETGYIVELDISYPIELHELFKEYPPCPENVAAKEEWMSDYQKEIAKLVSVSHGLKCYNLSIHESIPTISLHFSDPFGPIFNKECLSALLQDLALIKPFN
jgi:hypothetical protein